MASTVKNNTRTVIPREEADRAFFAGAAEATMSRFHSELATPNRALVFIGHSLERPTAQHPDQEAVGLCLGDEGPCLYRPRQPGDPEWPLGPPLGSDIWALFGPVWPRFLFIPSCRVHGRLLEMLGFGDGVAIGRRAMIHATVESPDLAHGAQAWVAILEWLRMGFNIVEAVNHANDVMEASTWPERWTVLCDRANPPGLR